MLELKKIFEASRKVIEQCSLENGAIVAANANSIHYPSKAKNYFYVWPRDASYACLAADILGLREFQENFFGWCLKRAEGFDTTGLLFEKYHTNGLKALCRFQPDQTATVLVAINHHYKKNSRWSPPRDLIEKAANGMCNKWERDHFSIIVNDLWEERLAFPDLKENFTYSLAACIRGLECATEIIPTDRWTCAAEEMRCRLEAHSVDGCIVRSYGDYKFIDKSIDASMLGLVYPFEIYAADNPAVTTTVQEIEKRLIIDGGVHRYELDHYDGWVHEGMPRNKGAGGWPLLNFWMSIYYSIKGDKVKALEYYYWVLQNIKNKEGYIPEQIFGNPRQVSVSPLLWSHAMFIIASKFLGYI